MREFWEQVMAGVIDAMGGEANEPFGLWPQPPLPEPERWAERIFPIIHDERKDSPPPHHHPIVSNLGRR